MLPFQNRFILRENEEGQILLIAVLVMVVALTVGLSVVSRSIVHVKTSSEEIDSQKAFSAAEAGVEQALQGVTVSSANPQSLANNAKISQSSISYLGGANNFLMNNGEPVHQDDGSDIWLTTYDPNIQNITPNAGTQNVSIYWGDTGFSCSSQTDSAAVEVIVLTGPKASPVITHYAYDACSGRRTSNSFAAPTATGSFTVGGKTLQYRADLPSITSGIFARVIPLYSDTNIGVTGDVILPQQGQIITATGISGNTQRKVSLFQAYQSVPTEFFYTLFSPQ